jgi:cytoskeletal protein CcmA (bactofilin family)
VLRDFNMSLDVDTEKCELTVCLGSAQVKNAAEGVSRMRLCRRICATTEFYARKTWSTLLVIKGELSCSEELYVDGEVEGVIDPQGNRLTIGPNGRVKADMSASTVVVQGKLEGNIQASDRVDLKQSAVVTGDIAAQHISIDEGAYFKGRVNIEKEGQKKSIVIARSFFRLGTSPRSMTTSCSHVEPSLRMVPKEKWLKRKSVSLRRRQAAKRRAPESSPGAYTARTLRELAVEGYWQTYTVLLRRKIYLSLCRAFRAGEFARS